MEKGKAGKEVAKAETGAKTIPRMEAYSREWVFMGSATDRGLTRRAIQGYLKQFPTAAHFVPALH